MDGFGGAAGMVRPAGIEKQRQAGAVPVCTIYDAKIQFEPCPPEGYTGLIKEV